jgi:uncharacterized protein (DUF433 family)
MQIILDQHIETNQGVRGGKPCIVGTRIAVSDVVLMHLRQGQSLEQIAGRYNLALAAVHAAMTYYYDHQAEVDRAVREEDAEIQRLQDAAPSLLQAKLRTLGGG